ncbi:MAG: prepilin-type N-terminal cleavage/methylation domain-containing protein [Planctomycetes bacterium]|nr:prepilin-type N-terminal cleavage/methylation domain-containing protein [Planctomycetota bacterium]
MNNTSPHRDVHLAAGRAPGGSLHTRCGERPAAKWRTRRRHGFTLIELLVVLAILTALMAILMPSLARGRYLAKVVRCQANYRQWGVACIGYATDNLSWLPQFGPGQSTGHNTWDVGNGLLPALIPYGLTWDKGHGAWYCPLRSAASQNAADQNAALLSMQWTGGTFTIIPHNWWVPRKDTSNFWYPSTMTDPQGFFTKITDGKPPDRPLVSDLLNATLAAGANDPNAWSNGHAWNKQVESTSLLYIDGHVALHFQPEIKVRWQGNWDNLY